MEDYGYVVNVDGAVVRDGEYLFVERGADESHAAGSLAFPGGKLERPPGGEEAIERAVERELAEEVGVEVGSVEYVCSRTFEADDGTPCLNVVTLCEHVGGEAHRGAPGEVAAVRWLTPASLAERDRAPDYLRRDVERVERFRESRTA
jgi:8-oxo-dGTP diphosphatase